MPLLKLNTFRVRMRCLKRLINIKWQSKVTNNEVLKEVNLEIMFTLLKQRRMLWLGYFVRMNFERNNFMVPGGLREPAQQVDISFDTP